MILLIGNYPHDQQESMQRFAAMMLRGLTERGVAAELMAPKPFFGLLKPSGQGLGKWLGYLDKYLLFPIQLRRRIRQLQTSTSNVELPTSPSTPVLPASTSDFRLQTSRPILHICDHSNAHYTKYLKTVAHLVTCNDVLALRSARGDFPENKTKWTGRKYQALILKGLQRAHHIASISSNTRDELIEIAGIPKRGTSVVEMGLNYPYTPMPPKQALPLIENTLEKRGLESHGSGRFLMHIGGNQWYKNREGVVRIYLDLFQRVPDAPPLYLLGAELTSDLCQLIEASQGAKIVHLGKVSNEELRAFYSCAEALIFPSTREGFGWPIIEAQACGCRVATSNRPPMNDIGGEAAVYFDPEKLVDAAGVVAALLAEPLYARDQRIRDGLQNAERFSTERMLDQYCELYRSVVTESSGIPTHA